MALAFIATVVTSLLVDGGLVRVAQELGTGLGTGLVPMTLVGAVAAIGFLVLAVTTPSGDHATARHYDRQSAIGIEDLPPLIGVGARQTAHRGGGSGGAAF